MPSLSFQTLSAPLSLAVVATRFLPKMRSAPATDPNISARRTFLVFVNPIACIPHSFGNGWRCVPPLLACSLGRGGLITLTLSHSSAHRLISCRDASHTLSRAQHRWCEWLSYLHRILAQELKRFVPMTQSTDQSVRLSLLLLPRCHVQPPGSSRLLRARPLRRVQPDVPLVQHAIVCGLGAREYVRGSWSAGCATSE